MNLASWFSSMRHSRRRLTLTGARRKRSWAFDRSASFDALEDRFLLSTVSFSTGSETVSESAGKFSIPVTLSSPPDGTPIVSAFASAFDDPAGLAFDAAGNLYVASIDNNTVSEVSPAGVVINTLSGFDGPVGMAFDAAGNLYVANLNNNTVSEVSPEGVVSTFASGLSDPTGLAVDAAGNLYVGNEGNGTVSEVSPAGVVSPTPFASGLSFPVALAFDAVGNLYVANLLNNTVSKVSPAGAVSFFAGGFDDPKRPCVILGRWKSCCVVLGVSVAPVLVSCGQVESYFGHQCLHSRAPMVSRHIVVEVLPESFDAVVVRTVWWQEVKPDLAGCLRLQRQLNLAAVVYAVVIENEMNPTSTPVCLRDKLVKELEEQQAVLPIAFHPGQLTSLGIQSTGEVALLVAPRCEDVLLLPGEHPVGSNLGIEVNVNLVDVQNDLTTREVVDQAANRSQSPLPTRFSPGAVDGWFGPIQSNSQLSQKSTHRGDADADAGSLSKHENQQLLRPRGTPVAVVLRRAFNEAKQFHAVSVGDLVLPIVLAPIGESHQTMFDEPVGGSVHLRLRAQATLSDHGRCFALNEGQDNLATATHDGIRRSLTTPSDLLPFAPREILPRVYDLCLNQGGAPSTGVLDDTT